VIALTMVALSALILVVEGVRHHEPRELALVLTLLLAVGLGLRWLARDLRLHPAGFPAAGVAARPPR
jgi:hypothetical protein